MPYNTGLSGLQRQAAGPSSDSDALVSTKYSRKRAAATIARQPAEEEEEEQQTGGQEDAQQQQQQQQENGTAGGAPAAAKRTAKRHKLKTVTRVASIAKDVSPAWTKGVTSVINASASPLDNVRVTSCKKGWRIHIGKVDAKNVTVDRVVVVCSSGSGQYSCIGAQLPSKVLRSGYSILIDASAQNLNGHTVDGVVLDLTRWAGTSAAGRYIICCNDTFARRHVLASELQEIVAAQQGEFTLPIEHPELYDSADNVVQIGHVRRARLRALDAASSKNSSGGAGASAASAAADAGGDADDSDSGADSDDNANTDGAMTE